ncbi:hypothetical protein J5N97_021331 [Dioscorea zingiberensis]|uniref:Uncharacterized protein n=1 Tax=Dioscorea zingiberensis TaxID=325984 RepID=A0A9D5CHH1_9LILI|nr:hypothetical protein J5N97_021331 [Dioscorea zingiberensis]
MPGRRPLIPKASMDGEALLPLGRKQATSRICLVYRIGNVEENSHYKSKLITRSSFLNVTASYLVSFLGSFPAQFSRALVSKLLGQSWSTTAVDALYLDNLICRLTYLNKFMQYHTMRNVLFMVMTEFAKFSEEPDWTFMGEKLNQLALLFGIDDHWALLCHSSKSIIQCRMSFSWP